MNRVIALSADMRRAYKFDKHTYSYNPNQGYRWLQKICFGILEKLKCEAQYPVTFPEPKMLEVDKIVDRILKCQEVLEQIYFQHPKYLLVGHDFFADLIDDEIGGMLVMDAQLHLWCNGSPVLPIGLMLVLVPWMEGMLVMPELPTKEGMY